MIIKMERRTLFFIGGIVFVYFLGMFIDIMDLDAAQHAAISWEMSQNQSYLQVLQRGEDYLDKPPLLFWITSLVFQILGANNLTYRLFPILISLLGIYSTYRLSKLYMNKELSVLAGLFYASSFSVFLMNHDVRSDTMLTGFTVFSIWQLAEYTEFKKWKNFVFGFIGIGLSLLAKGPVALMVIVFAFSTHFILLRKYHFFWKWEWILGLLIILVMLLPMCIGLYQQFDMHPEKTVNGGRDTSGIYFYLWKQSFGRITGASEWKNDTDIFFFLHTYLWIVLPWGLITFFALFQSLKDIINKKKTLEYISLGGFIIPFIILSFSRYKLPHYINILIPMSSIIAAKYVGVLSENLEQKKSRIFFLIYQWIQLLAIWLLVFFICFLFFPLNNVYIFLLIVVFLGINIFFWKSSRTYLEKLVYPSLWGVISLCMILNIHFYPSLLKYQTGAVLGKYLKIQNTFPVKRFFVLQSGDGNDTDTFIHSLDFYSQRINPVFDEVNTLVNTIGSGSAWVYISEERSAELKKFGSVEIVLSFEKYHVTMLTLSFLNPKTRPETLTKTQLVKFTPL